MIPVNLCMSCAPKRCLSLSSASVEPGIFSPVVRTPECGVHTPASAPLSPARDGSSSPPVCGWWIPGVFGGFPDGEGSSGESAWYTCAVSSDSLCSLSVSVILLVFWFLVVFCCLPPLACHGRF